MKLNKLGLLAAVATLGAGGAAFAQTAPAAAPAAPAAPMPMPMTTPAMSATLSANPAPFNVDAGPLGKVYVTGAVTGIGFLRDHQVPGDHSGLLDLTNGQVFIQKTDGPIQFFVQAGAYSLPSLGFGYAKATTITENTYNVVPQAFVKFVPTPEISIQVGKLPTLIGAEYSFTVAHWAISEARFRKHVKAIKEEEAARLTLLDDQLAFVTQDDVVNRRVFDPAHRSYVPDFGSYIKAEEHGKVKYYAVTRQMVLFAVERRKSWRLFQSKAGLVNKDYLAQKAFLAKLDKGELPLADAKARTRELVAAEVAAVK